MGSPNKLWQTYPHVANHASKKITFGKTDATRDVVKNSWVQMFRFLEECLLPWHQQPAKEAFCCSKKFPHSGLSSWPTVWVPQAIPVAWQRIAIPSRIPIPSLCVSLIFSVPSAGFRHRKVGFLFRKDPQPEGMDFPNRCFWTSNPLISEVLVPGCTKVPP